MRITEIETIEMPADFELPQLLLVRVHTDEGISGVGDTYFLPQACREIILRDMAPALLGEDPCEIERHASTLLNSYFRFGGRGAEVRAWSAVEVALWDILGKRAGLPVCRLFGGTVRGGIRIYNSCGGAGYAKVTGGGARPGRGQVDGGQLADYQAVLERPGELAEELLAEGISGMKFWTFDAAAQASGPHRISAADLRKAIEPIEKIRATVGDQIDIMVDFHGQWSLPAAIEIAHALEPYRLTWAEDMMLAEVPAAMRRLKEATRVPILASEYLVTRFGYQAMLQAEAMDIAMIDPAWAGGIAESRKIMALAEAHGIPVAFHDCAGPINLFAGVHLAASAQNVMYQETLRSFIRLVYPKLVTELPVVADGRAFPPDRPGLGTELQPDLVNRPGVVVTRARAR